MVLPADQACAGITPRPLWLYCTVTLTVLLLAADAAAAADSLIYVAQAANEQGAVVSIAVSGNYPPCYSWDLYECSLDSASRVGGGKLGAGGILLSIETEPRSRFSPAQYLLVISDSIGAPVAVVPAQLPPPPPTPPHLGVIVGGLIGIISAAVSILIKAAWDSHAMESTAEGALRGALDAGAAELEKWWPYQDDRAARLGQLPSPLDTTGLAVLSGKLERRRVQTYLLWALDLRAIHARWLRGGETADDLEHLREIRAAVHGQRLP